MRFHSFRVLSPARTGVEGLRSHSRGSALRALIGVKLKELSVGGLAELLVRQAVCVSLKFIWRCVKIKGKGDKAPEQEVRMTRLIQRKQNKYRIQHQKEIKS